MGANSAWNFGQFAIRDCPADDTAVRSGMVRVPPSSASLLLVLASACSSAPPAPAARAVERDELRRVVRATPRAERYSLGLASLPRRPEDGTVEGPGAAIVPTVVARSLEGDCDPGELTRLAAAIVELSNAHHCGNTACVRLFCLGETKMQMLVGLDPTSAPLWLEGEKRPLPFAAGSEEPLN